MSVLMQYVILQLHLPTWEVVCKLSHMHYMNIYACVSIHIGYTNTYAGAYIKGLFTLMLACFESQLCYI